LVTYNKPYTPFYTFIEFQNTPNNLKLLIEVKLMDESSRVRMVIGDRIRMIRNQKRLTQKGLSELAKLNEKYISHVERGGRNVTLDTLIKITAALGISLEELFKGVQPVQGETCLLINQIISILQTRDEEEQKFILDFINMLLRWKR
jgi:XRE family transcriptional regulator, regulator of sulfur utilization